ncbi:uncharacterized protein METZ01_LOCUS182779, partial [marine metagenome]
MPFRLLFTPLVTCLILVSCEVEPSPLPTPLATVSISEKITKQEDVSRKINTPDPVYIPPTPSPIPIFSSPMVIPGDRDLEDLARRY